MFYKSTQTITGAPPKYECILVWHGYAFLAYVYVGACLCGGGVRRLRAYEGRLAHVLEYVYAQVVVSFLKERERERERNLSYFKTIIILLFLTA